MPARDGGAATRAARCRAGRRPRAAARTTAGARRRTAACSRSRARRSCGPGRPPTRQRRVAARRGGDRRQHAIAATGRELEFAERAGGGGRRAFGRRRRRRRSEWRRLGHGRQRRARGRRCRQRRAAEDRLQRRQITAQRLVATAVVERPEAGGEFEREPLARQRAVEPRHAEVQQAGPLCIEEAGVHAAAGVSEFEQHGPVANAGDDRVLHGRVGTEFLDAGQPVGAARREQVFDGSHGSCPASRRVTCAAPRRACARTGRRSARASRRAR